MTGNHFRVIPNDCRRQPWVFKQTKTFWRPLTWQTPGLDPSLSLTHNEHQQRYLHFFNKCSYSLLFLVIEIRCCFCTLLL